MISLFTGPAPLAEMVRDELAERGVAAELRSEEPLGQIFGSVAGPAGMQSVLVTEDERERFRTAIDEVLAMVTEVDEGGEVEAEGEEAAGE